MAADDRKRGLYRKYIVYRADGSHQTGRRHSRCDYFVLDLDHDKFSVDALKAYVAACKTEYPKLAEDLETIIKKRSP